MLIVTKEQMQDLDQAIDERIVWEFLALSSEIKIALLVSNLATPENVDAICNEYIEIKRLEMTSKKESNKLEGLI